MTLEDVATEAGVGAVTVYRRFGDRKGLLQAYVAERSPRRLVHTLPLDGSGDRDANLLALTRESITFLRQHRAVFALLFSSDPEAQALMAEAREGSTSVRELTARYLDVHFPDPTGRTVLAFYGLMLSVAWAGRGAPEDDARFVVTSFLHGVCR
jgi:AcrR family transcriptional regulator